jgi:hypothetical protein
MNNIDWDEQVQVKLAEHSNFGEDHAFEDGILKWRGISLAEAVERCMGLPPDERAKASILTPSGYFGQTEIEVLFQRRDFPHSIGLN